MHVNEVQNNPSFGIKIAPHFSQTVQNFYHYGQIPNKNHLIWAFNQKAEKFKAYGFDDFTLDYEKRLEKGNWEHLLVAINDSNPKNKVIIANKNTLAKIIIRFMEIKQNAFRNIMKSSNK